MLNNLLDIAAYTIHFLLYGVLMFEFCLPKKLIKTLQLTRNVQLDCTTHCAKMFNKICHIQHAVV